MPQAPKNPVISSPARGTKAEGLPHRNRKSCRVTTAACQIHTNMRILILHRFRFHLKRTPRHSCRTAFTCKAPSYRAFIRRLKVRDFKRHRSKRRIFLYLLIRKSCASSRHVPGFCMRSQQKLPMQPKLSSIIRQPSLIIQKLAEKSAYSLLVREQIYGERPEIPGSHPLFQPG